MRKIKKAIKKPVKKMTIEGFSTESFEEDLYLINLDNKKDLADMVYLAEKARAEKIKRSNKLVKLAAIREIAVDRDINTSD